MFLHCDAVFQEQDHPSLFLTWVFYNQDVAYTPVKTAGISVEYDSSSVHRVTVNDEFLEYLKKVREEAVGKFTVF
jgi:hypothetical protein